MCDYCAGGHEVGRCEARKQSMFERYVAGETLAAIGADHGLTRERVRQVVAKVAPEGMRTVESARAARRAMQAAELAVLRQRVLDHLRVAPTAQRDEITAALSCSAGDLRDALGGDAGRLILTEKVVERILTRGDVLESLRAAAAWYGTDTLTGPQYDEYHRVVGAAVGTVRVWQLFGTWSKALVAAGLTPHVRRRVYSRRWTTSDMVSWVVRYLADPASRGTYAEYGEWAVERGGPSAQTIRNAFGSWTAAKSAALPVLHAEALRAG